MNSIVKNIIVILSLIFLGNSLPSQNYDSLIIKYNYINTIPQNAEVYINNNYIGSTPVRFTNEIINIDTTGGNNVLIKLKDYLDFKFSFNYSDLPLYKNIDLTPVNPSIQTDLVQKNSSDAFKTPRNIIPVTFLGIATIGSAVLSFYYKRVSNDWYDEYLLIGDRGLLDKIKRYDLYSGIALGVLQVSFVTFLYYLLIK